MNHAAFRVLALIEYIQLRSRVRHVVDFGGSLGHYYFRLRPHLLGPLHWQVVDLPAMIEAAAEFGSDELTFHVSLSDIPVPPDLVLASGAIQYVRDPYACIAELQDLGSSWLIVDRLPLIETPRDRLTVQDAKGVYDARYPAWFLSRDRFEAVWAGWQRLLDWMLDAPGNLDGEPIPQRGYVFRRIPDRSSRAAPPLAVQGIPEQRWAVQGIPEQRWPT